MADTPQNARRGLSGCEDRRRVDRRSEPVASSRSAMRLPAPGGDSRVLTVFVIWMDEPLDRRHAYTRSAELLRTR